MLQSCNLKETLHNHVVKVERQKKFFLKKATRVIAQQFHIVIVQIHKARMQFMSRSDVSDPDLLFKCEYGVNCALNLHG